MPRSDQHVIPVPSALIRGSPHHTLHPVVTPTRYPSSVMRSLPRALSIRSVSGELNSAPRVHVLETTRSRPLLHSQSVLAATVRPTILAKNKNNSFANRRNQLPCFLAHAPTSYAHSPS